MFKNYYIKKKLLLNKYLNIKIIEKLIKYLTFNTKKTIIIILIYSKLVKLRLRKTTIKFYLRIVYIYNEKKSRFPQTLLQSPKIKPAVQINFLIY